MMTSKDILNLKVNENTTIYSYLYELLDTLWNEKERFSGERPFGESYWEYDLYIPLIHANIIAGEIDEDGNLKHCDVEKANLIIRSLISHIFFG